MVTSQDHTFRYDQDNTDHEHKHVTIMCSKQTHSRSLYTSNSHWAIRHFTFWQDITDSKFHPWLWNDLYWRFLLGYITLKCLVGISFKLDCLKTNKKRTKQKAYNGGKQHSVKLSHPVLQCGPYKASVFCALFLCFHLSLAQFQFWRHWIWHWLVWYLHDTTKESAHITHLIFF